MLIFLLAVLESEEDRRKFTVIYEQHHTRLENVAMSILKNQTDAEDAVQNAFMQIIRHFKCGTGGTVCLASRYIQGCIGNEISYGLFI